MATFGDTSAGADTINVSANQAIVGKFTLSESADVTSVSIYCKAQAGTANIKGLIYADSAGSPGAQKAVGSVVNINTTAAFQTSNVTVSLTAGDYWLGVVADAAITVNEDAVGGAQTSLKTSFTYASPADPYGSETSNDDGFQVNAYATYTPPAAGPTIDTQPANGIADIGATAAFSISATTSGGTLHYQWKLGGSNVGTDSSSYTTGTLALTDDGTTVTCDVTDDNGTTSSATAYVRIRRIFGAVSGRW